MNTDRIIRSRIARNRTHISFFQIPSFHLSLEVTRCKMSVLQGSGSEGTTLYLILLFVLKIILDISVTFLIIFISHYYLAMVIAHVLSLYLLPETFNWDENSLLYSSSFILHSIQSTGGWLSDENLSFRNFSWSRAKSFDANFWFSLIKSLNTTVNWF